MFSEKCYDRGISSWNLKLLFWGKFFKSISISVDLGKKSPNAFLLGQKNSCMLKASGCVCTHAHMCTLKCILWWIHDNVWQNQYSIIK